MGAAGKSSEHEVGDVTPAREDAVSVRTHAEPPNSLYAARQKVYPKAIDGLFRRVKWGVLIVTLGIYYLVPFLRWDRGPNEPSQAVLIDLTSRKAFFFGIEIWPQQVYYITGLLILAAVGLFLLTSLLGRVWCGYACPQTVWTDLFMLVERMIEGDRNARIKLDKAPLSLGKAVKKVTKHTAWLVIALATGGAWILYFHDAPTVIPQLFLGQATTATYFFIGLCTVFTYLLAGWAREQVCTYMCPWPRFQSAMRDEQSMIVSYEAWRGEPRGRLKAETAAGRAGDCIDCNKCVAVCPTGIDIRDGSQLECIGCGLCIDACNTVMRRIGRPLNLIAFDTLANQQAEAVGKTAPYRFVRTRTIIYTAMLALVGGIMLAALITRSNMDINVLHERNPLYTMLSGGDVRNGYTVHLLNMTEGPQTYRLSISGLASYRMEAIGITGQGGPGHPLELPVAADTTTGFRIYVTVPHDHLAGPSTEFHFVVDDRAIGETARHRTVFLAPGK